MKKTAKKRIIIWSIVAVLLVGVLVSGMCVTSNMGGLRIFSSNNISQEYKNAKDTSKQSEYSTDTVNKIQVKMSSGKITVNKSSDNKIHLEKQCEDEKDDIIYKLDENGKLVIYDKAFNSNNVFENWFVFTSDKKKSISISVPNTFQFENVKIESISADINVEDLNTKDCTLTSTSGQINIDNSKCNNIELYNTSGDIKSSCKVSKEMIINTVSGYTAVSTDCSKITANAVSGQLAITANNNIKTINADSVSGDCIIKVPKDIKGFNLCADTVSGTKSSNFVTTTKGDNIQYGNGVANFDVNTVSGSIYVNYSD